MSIYVFISYQHRYIHCMRRFIPTKEKNVLHLVTLTRKYGITCINLNQSHLPAELLSLKVSFALFTKGCNINMVISNLINYINELTLVWLHDKAPYRNYCLK